jgi:hypothetical protein
MQSSMPILQHNWSELLGWALVLAGLALATWTLAEERRPRQASSPKLKTLLAAPFARGPDRRLDPDREWRQVVEIAERRFAAIENVAALQARAEDEVAAADRAATELLAHWTAFLAWQAGAGDAARLDAEPTRENPPRPLAA